MLNTFLNFSACVAAVLCRFSVLCCIAVQCGDAVLEQIWTCMGRATKHAWEALEAKPYKGATKQA